MEINIWEIIKFIILGLWNIWELCVILLVFIVIGLSFKWFDLEINNWRIRRKFKKGKEWRSNRDLLYWLRGMKPSEFEHYIADLFSRLGYKTQVVGGPNDGGIDVIAEKEGIKYYIQCKKYISQKVAVSDVRDFYGALADHLVNGQGYFITTNEFTLSAQKFAEDKPIELIDSFKLTSYIRMAEKKNNIDKTPINKVSQPCPKCGGNLVERTGNFKAFYGCSNYPKCKHIVEKN